MTDERQTPSGVPLDRRTLLKSAVAAGVVGVTYAAPKISAVPAYANAGTLVSYTQATGLLCVYFSPNQENFGNWHPGTGVVGAANNLNPITGATGGASFWDCYPPAMRVSVVVNGVTRYVDFVGNPDNWIGTKKTTTCTSGGTPGSTVDDYTQTQPTPQWSGGGVKISLYNSPGCEINVSGSVVIDSKGTTRNLGPYCNYASCDNTNDVGPPATWAQGSSTSPIGSPTTAGTQPNGNVGAGVFKSAYYHTGLPGSNQNNRCKFTLLFQVRCRS